MSKQKDLGRALEHRVADKAKAKGLTAKRQPGSGMFKEAPHDDVIENLLVECKVRSLTTDAKGEDRISFPINALRKVQASALVNGFDQGILVVNPKGSQSPFVLMDFDWFLSLLAELKLLGRLNDELLNDLEHSTAVMQKLSDTQDLLDKALDKSANSL
jgi:hypothetical protein